MIYRVIVISQFHEANVPEIDLFYYETNLTLKDFAKSIIVDDTFNVNKWFNNHMREGVDNTNPEQVFETALGKIQLDKTTCDFEGRCCEDCHDWLVISEYKKEKVYKN